MPGHHIQDRLEAYNISDLREIALKRIPKFLFEFLDRGVEDEVALRNNRAAFERIKLKSRTLVDVSGRSQETTLFGNKQSLPIAIAPTGSAGLMWHEGELALASAARQAGIPFALSISSITPMEKIAEQAGGRLWFQLNIWADRSKSHQVVKRAMAAGFEGLIVTVDQAAQANREYNKRNGFSSSFFNRKNIIDVMMHPRWLLGVFMRYMMTTGMPCRANFPDEMKRLSILTKSPSSRNDSLTWNDLKTLREMWPGKLMVKGILHPQDAVLAADCGVDAVIVSNHGGRSYDSAMAPIEVLPKVVDAVGKRIAVIVDSGFRRGSDVVKALALGANAVLIGRSTLYGTAVAGQDGAALAIEIFRQEINRVMGQIGCRSIAELNRDYLELP